MHFEALSTKYVNFNHFGWFFENFVTKFLFFWQFFLSFLVWEIILLSKNLSILGIFHLSYTQREIKKIIFQTSSTCKFASWTWQGKLKQSKFSANRLELARNTSRTCIIASNKKGVKSNVGMSAWFGDVFTLILCQIFLASFLRGYP